MAIPTPRGVAAGILGTLVAFSGCASVAGCDAGVPGVDSSSNDGAVPADGGGSTDSASAADGSSPADGGQTSLADGALSSGPPGTLILQIGGTEQAVTYDVMRVGGKAILGGQLVLQYTGGYVPPAGQQFILIEADGGIAGTFATITSPGVQVEAGQNATTYWVTVK